MTDPNDQTRTALFISHATPEDNDFVRWLGAKLAAMGYEVWADVMRLHGGADWARQLEEALRKRAVKMLLVCTPSGLDKQGVRNEIEIGTQLSRKLGDNAFILPLRLQAYEAPFRIAHIQYIDFKGGWARGLAELTALLDEMAVPRGKPGAMQLWLDSHAEGSTRLQVKSEPLVSNWLELQNQPRSIFYCEPPVGAPLDRFQHRQCHSWPAVPHRGGVITFAVPDESGNMGPNLAGKKVSSISTDTFLEEGWVELGIDAFQARKNYSDIGSQAFDLLCKSKGLSGYVGSGGRISWWGDVKTMPLNQVRFDWNFRRGSRKIIGHSPKRGVHWHYALNAYLRTAPVRHLRLASRLVFSENGLDPLNDKRRAHTLRRSLAKGWRNARWRDMLCAYIWWLGGGERELRLPVSVDGHLTVSIPPMQFSCPVSVPEIGEDADDEDDPDIPVGEWIDEVEEDAEEGEK
jgi:hypothetical protein